MKKYLEQLSYAINFLIKITEKFIYGLRNILIIMYLAMGIHFLMFSLNFIKELLPEGWMSWLPRVEIVNMIEDVDFLMIGNLIVMIIIGGWQIFIRKFSFSQSSDKPQWLDHINSGILKVKTCMSLAGVTCVLLLKELLEKNINSERISITIVITIVFLIASFVFAKVDTILHPPVARTDHNNQSNKNHSETIKQQTEHEEKNQ